MVLDILFGAAAVILLVVSVGFLIVAVDSWWHS